MSYVHVTLAVQGQARRHTKPILAALVRTNEEARAVRQHPRAWPTEIGDSIDMEETTTRRHPKLSTAYHEAGHAVMAHLLGLKVARASIKADGRWYAKYLEATGEGRSAGHVELTTASHRHMTPVKDRLYSVAGLAAQMIHDDKDGRVLTRRREEELLSGARSDLEVFDRDPGTEVFDEFLANALEMLGDNWHLVDGLADALMAHRFMWGKEVHRVLAVASIGAA